MTIKVGEILVKQGLIRPDQLSHAIEEQRKTGNKITAILITQGAIKDPQILRALEKHYTVPGVAVATFEVDPAIAQLVPRELCEKHNIIPIQKAGQTLVVAFSDPSNIMVREDLRFITKMKIQPVVATPMGITAALEKTYGGSINIKTMGAVVEDSEDQFAFSGQSNEVIDGDSIAEEAPVVKFVNAILIDAINKRASDIHFEPYEKKYRIRFRVDGNLIEQSSPPSGTGAALASRLKIMSKLDIAEKRRPQDGRLKIRTSKGKEMDFRVSILPTMWGEKVVLRLLDKSNLQLDMTKLGFEEKELQLFKSQIHLPQGMVLITGPTGSGKTTTIYSALADLNQPDVNISTAEDPIEFNLQGINQVQMNPDIELNFANALRSFLRQDPDIIMVGEIRDLETAEIAIKAASTGHLVVSTLHTNDAPSTVSRLVEMGVPAYIITSTINLIVAQRLVGRICEACKHPIQIPAETLINLGVDPDEVHEYQIYKGRGCVNCNNTGIKGRLAIYELLTFNDRIREAILKGASNADIRNLARQDGMSTLRRSALVKLKKGLTTIEEVVNASVKDS